MRMVVVLPAPFRPTNPMRSPGCTRRSGPSGESRMRAPARTSRSVAVITIALLAMPWLMSGSSWWPHRRRTSSVGAAFGACRNRFLEVGGEQTDEKLSQALGLHMPFQATGVQSTPQRAFGQLDSRPGEHRDPGRDRIAGVQQLAFRHLARHQPDPLGLLGGDVAAGQHDLERARRSDSPGQQIAQPQFAGGQPVVDARGPEIGAGGGHPDVGGQRQTQSAADGRPVDRGDHRLVQPPQRQDDVVEELHGPQRIGRPGQPVDVGHRAGGLVIRARGEAPARPGQHHHSDRIVVRDLLQGLFERHHDVERHRIHPLGPIEGYQRDSGARVFNQDQIHL